jgi:collagen type I/II/III/V/XI/XXIV/XXVII alpha
MMRLRPPGIVLVAAAGTALWLGCGSTPRDQNLGMDGSGYEPPLFEAGPDTGDAADDADASDETGGASGTGGSAGAGGTAGASGAGGTSGADGASDAISDAGADG